MNRFWNWLEPEAEGEPRELRIDGAIAEESWWEDDVTPKVFRDELTSGKGDITLWINSPGGDCIAASQIYTMLMDYKGKVTVKIDGMAASAASVIAMAGTTVQMSPTAMLMIHNPATMAFGDSKELKKAQAMLEEVKESIVNAYELKTGMNRDKLSKLMDSETWMNAKLAVDYGFADEMIGGEAPENFAPVAFSRRAMNDSLIQKIKASKHNDPTEPGAPIGVPVEQLNKRLELLRRI